MPARLSSQPPELSLVGLVQDFIAHGADVNAVLVVGGHSSALAAASCDEMERLLLVTGQRWLAVKCQLLMMGKGGQQRP
jgi:hypothetical protein